MDSACSQVKFANKLKRPTVCQAKKERKERKNCFDFFASSLPEMTLYVASHLKSMYVASRLKSTQICFFSSNNAGGQLHVILLRRGIIPTPSTRGTP